MRRSVVGGIIAIAALVGGGPLAAAQEGDRVDPTTLDRGENPAVVHLVRDTIRDGDRRVPATSRGRHVDLWTVAGGYVVDDVVGPRNVYRLVFVSRSGQKRLIARRLWPMGTAVSSSGRWIGWGEALGRDPGPPSVVKVANPRSGRIVATRRFHWATVLGVSDQRVLLTRMGERGRTTTWWWNYRRDTLAKVSQQPGIRADLVHRRIVLGVGPQDSFCRRVAPLGNPERTLWRSCTNIPRSWSPDGTRTLSTYTYFDDTGTARWVVRGDRTGRRLGRVTGRFDWDAAWEDDGHFLVVAQGDDGNAAIVRCTAAGRCERASRLWTLEEPDYLPNYIAPPVVLPNN